VLAKSASIAPAIVLLIDWNASGRVRQSGDGAGKYIRKGFYFAVGRAGAFSGAAPRYDLAGDGAGIFCAV
jgi:hypothetical protein